MIYAYPPLSSKLYIVDVVYFFFENVSLAFTTVGINCILGPVKGQAVHHSHYILKNTLDIYSCIDTPICYVNYLLVLNELASTSLTKIDCKHELISTPRIHSANNIIDEINPSTKEETQYKELSSGEDKENRRSSNHVYSDLGVEYNLYILGSVNPKLVVNFLPPFIYHYYSFLMSEEFMRNRHNDENKSLNIAETIDFTENAAFKVPYKRNKCFNDKSLTKQLRMKFFTTNDGNKDSLKERTLSIKSAA